jgi:formylglycine-generating enzyme required for sulfatase activity
LRLTKTAFKSLQIPRESRSRVRRRTLLRKARGDAEIHAGEYPVGLTETARFGFDNENPGFVMTLEGYKTSKTLVPHREYLQFVEDGGYQYERHCSFGGKRWLATSRALLLEEGG